jgi:hypothetical protein
MRALAPLLASFHSPDLTLLWPETLHLVAARTRPELLGDLASLGPWLACLAGSQPATEIREIARDIADVGRWWS